MGYAVKPNGSFRAATKETALSEDEYYSETEPKPSPEQILAERLRGFEAVVDGYIQQTIAPKNYKSIDRAALYTDDPECGAEARALIVWNRAVWRAAYGILNACRAGERKIPLPEELIAELPIMAWPE